MMTRSIRASVLVVLALVLFTVLGYGIGGVATAQAECAFRGDEDHTCRSRIESEFLREQQAIARQAKELAEAREQERREREERERQEQEERERRDREAAERAYQLAQEAKMAAAEAARIAREAAERAVQDAVEAAGDFADGVADAIGQLWTGKASGPTYGLGGCSNGGGGIGCI
jgi:flagellar biosynthesis GTPase FlhF